MLFQLKILTPQEIFFDDLITSLIAPATDGFMGILAAHAPLMTLLKAGTLQLIDRDGEKRFYAISSGFLSVHSSEATILLDEIREVEAALDVDVGVEGSPQRQ